MDNTTNPALPLARTIGDSRGSLWHRIVIPLPEVAKGRGERYATAALAALIHRYTGRADVSIASPTGAVELRVSADTTVGELLAAVAAASPVPGAGAGAYGAVCPVGGQHPTTEAPLCAVVYPDRIELAMYQAEFEAAAACQYGRHLHRLLAALTVDPTAVVRRIPLLAKDELRSILLEWNQTDAPVPDAYFHERIAEIARRTPDQVAIVWPGGTLTYAELDRLANQLAHRLKALGVHPRERVAVCFPRGAESLIAQLACFKLAVAAVLLDPDFPGDRLRFMIEDGAAVVVLTTAASEAKVSGVCPVVSLDTIDWRTEPDAPVQEVVGADDLIHVCYTSGSTGLPKAVLVRHGAARNLIYSMLKLCEVSSESHGTWLAAPGYGMVEVECFPVLAAGATVHIPEPSVVTSPEWLRDWFVAERINTTLLMKAMAERLWTLEWPEDTALRNIRICGERVLSWPPATLPFRIINLYGSAEATVVASCDLVELAESLGEDGRARYTPPIGRPTANVKTYVLGENLEPLPPGVVGELCVAGDSLSAGYLNRPEATAEKWIRNPIDEARHPVLYRTGDLARYWIDGSIEIVGRTDNQVKVRGNRVHLGEIEVVLAAQPGVSQAVVVARKDAGGDTRLIAYIEPAPAVEPMVREIRAALQATLPSFMVPSAYVVANLPTTMNGKIDRNALPEPPRSRPDVRSPYQQPRDETERALHDLWTHLLDIDDVGVLDNFFELGGDSIRAATLTAQIQSTFGVGTDLDELFDEPSIARMAQAISAARRA